LRIQVFRNVATRRYDYSLFVRLYSRLTQPLAGMLRPHRSTVSTLTPEELAALRDSSKSSILGLPDMTLRFLRLPNGL
jgi:hypothetical protein